MLAVDRMMRRLVQPGFLLIALLMSPRGAAQTIEPAMVASATLPESNEAVLLSSQAEEAIRRADYRLAFELIERTRQLGAGLAPSPASRTYHPVWRHAQRLLEQLPPAGVEFYRNLHDGEVSARLEQAVAQTDLPELRELFRTFRLSSHWPAVGRELAALLIDLGRYSEAVEVLQELRRAAPDDLVSAAQLATALARSGAWEAAERLLDDLQKPNGPAADPARRPRPFTLTSEWLAASVRSQQATGRAPLAPQLVGSLEWSVNLSAADSDAPRDRDEDVALAIRAERKLPLIAPVVADDTLVVRAAGRLHAYDIGTLSPLWTARESGLGIGTGQPERQVLRISGTDTIEVTLDTRLLLNHALRHSVSAGAGLVFTIEGLKREAPSQATPFRIAGGARSGALANELVARDLRTGEQLWRAGADPASPLFGAVFQAAPLVRGHDLLAPLARRESLLLAVLDARSGELLREVTIVAPPTRFTPEGGRVLIAADESRVFVSTGNGVIAAFGRQDLEWQWATVYPSTLGSFLGRMWWQPETPVVESGVDPLLISSDLVIVAPVDTTDIFALDRFSGRERWHAPRGEYTFLVGVAESGLIVGGNGLSCLSLDDGRTVRWRSVPLEVCGRPTLAGRRVYVPTRLGVVALDAASGKVIEDPYFRLAPEQPAAEHETRAAAHPLAANLIALQDMLLMVSPNRVVKLPDVELARSRIERHGAAHAGAALQIEAAWLDALEQGFDQALARLKDLRAADPRLQAARDGLLAQVCTALARRAEHDDERLQWLAQAAALTSDQGEAARLAALVGQALAGAGRKDDSIRHYHSLLRRSDDAFMAPLDGGRLRQAGAVLALRRIGELLAASSPHEASTRWDELVEAVSLADSGGGLLALLSQMAPEPQRAQIARLLCSRKLPPELSERHLGGVDHSKSPEERQERLIERWDMHVALGQLAAARADAAAWRDQFGDAPARATTSELDRLELIRTAMAKLERAEAPVWTRDASRLTRLWKLTDAQAILDPRSERPLMAGVIIRHLEDNRLNLHHALTGVGRREESAELRNRGGLHALEDETTTLTPDEPWPSVCRDNLVALPVPGGLICRGLGIERYGGTRLWERTVPEWSAVPRDFDRSAFAGERGLYFCPRGGAIALADWHSGRVLWQRQLPDRQVGRAYELAGRLVVLTTDGHVFSMDAAFGDDLQYIALGDGARVEPVGETLIAVTAGGLVGLDPRTLQERWSESRPGIDRIAAIAGADCLAYRTGADGGWRVVEAADGALRLPDCLPTVGLVHAWARTPTGAWIVAGRKSGAADSDRLVLASLSERGQVNWETEVDTRVAPTVSQLLAHPTLIPLLVLRSGSSGEGVDRRSLAVQMIERDSGAAYDPKPVDTYFPDGPNPGAVYMVCTPTVMLVQGFGCVVAFGESP